MDTLLPAVATGGAVVAVSLYNRHRRAAAFGIVAPERHAVAGAGARAALRAAAVGVASGVGFAAATTGEQVAAHALERGLARVLGREPVARMIACAFSTSSVLSRTAW